MEVMTMPERPEKEDFKENLIYKDLNTEYNIYKSWKKINKWQLMINNVLSFARN